MSIDSTGLVATVIVSDSELLDAATARLRAALDDAGALLGETAPLGPDACDSPVDGLSLPDARRIAATLADDMPADIGIQPVAGRRKCLLVADMDSTMITVECVDELADFAGLKPQVARITEAAMRGELDFADALRERVALLADMPVETLERCFAERVRAIPGAEMLIRTMGDAGARTVLVSGGFTFFTERVAAMLGFSRQVANRLEIVNGKLTGQVRPPIVDSATKLATLHAEAEGAGLAMQQVMAVGDGANDIPMIKEAGLGVAYRAKPTAAAAADVAIRHGDLTALLYLQGYRRDAFRA